MAAPESNDRDEWHEQQEEDNRPQRRRSGWKRAAKMTAAVLLALLILAAGVAGVVVYRLAQEAPRVAELDRGSLDRATIVYAAGGEVITRYFEKNRTWVSLDAISPAIVEALIATEDRRFYDHAGVDVRRTLAAVYQTLTGQRQGGSTITMQLARNIFPELKRDPPLERKVKEWITALRLEEAYSKREILETYLNTVPFVFRAYGIEAAALTYFDKHAADLGPLAAATLVGMLKGPSFYNPVLHPEQSRTRRNAVLENMVEAGFLARSTFEALRTRATPLDFHPVTPENNLAPFFAEYVRRQLDAWAEAHDYNLYTSGLRVYTTLDASLQQQAEAALHSTLADLQDVVDVSWSAASPPYFSTRFDGYAEVRPRVDAFSHFWATHPGVIDRLIRGAEAFRALRDDGLSADEATQRLRADPAFVDSLQTAAARLQGGFLALDPDDGRIRAWVGGRDFTVDQFDHVAQARRQPGSTFKPFVYAAALASGYTPDDRLPDRQFRYVNEVTGQVWAPGNFGGETGRLLTLREALTHSKNTITAQLVMQLGPERIADYAHRMGLRSALDAVPSIGLGTSPVSLLELTAAYTTLADLGTYHEPIAITRIENRRGEVLADFEPSSAQVIPPAVAYGVLDMMQDVVDEGTGVRIRHQYEATGPLAGKTGTTQRGADGWFMLIHPDLIMGSWVGFDLPELTFRTNWWGQGAHTALHTTGRFYNRLDLPDGTFEMPQVLRAYRTGRPVNAPGEAAMPTGTDAAIPWDAVLPAGPAGGPSLRADTLSRSGWIVPPAVGQRRPTQGNAYRPPAPDGSLTTEQLNRRERQRTEVDRYLDALREQ